MQIRIARAAETDQLKGFAFYEAIFGIFGVSDIQEYSGSRDIRGLIFGVLIFGV